MPSTRLYRKLDEYQQDAVEFALEVKTAGLFFEQGTGKTWICGGILEALMGPSFEGLLVVPLTNFNTTWTTFLAAQLPGLHVCLTLEELKASPAPKLMLVHYEALPSIIKKLQRRRWTFIGFDESQRLKARGTGQSRHASKLRNAAEYKLLLSGTPMDEQPTDLWAQFRFLAPDVLGTRWKDFEDHYLEPIDIDLDQYRPGSMRWHRMQKLIMIKKRKRSFDFSKLGEFLERIRPYALRVTKDVLDLPPLAVHEEEVELEPRQQALYDRMKKTGLVKINGQAIMAPMKMTKDQKLHQIAGGYLIDETGEAHEVGRSKMRRLLRILKSQPKPVVIFANYLEEVWSIHDELVDLYRRVEVITGRNKKHRTAIIEAFQRGEVDVVICQIKTGGVGVDLFASCVAIVYSFNHSFIVFDQMLSRLHRRGQTRPVHIFLLVGAGTVDARIYRKVLSKSQTTRRVLNPLKGDTPCRSPRKIGSTMSPRSPRSWASRRPASASPSGTVASPRPARATAGTRRPTTRTL